MTLEELIKETLSNGIPVVGVEYDKACDSLVYEVSGFSKSGTAKLLCRDGKIICETRYNQVDEIEDFDDLVAVAYEWNKNYCDREPFGWDMHWLPLFEKNGLVELKHVEVTKVVPLAH